MESLVQIHGNQAANEKSARPARFTLTSHHFSKAHLILWAGLTCMGPSTATGMLGNTEDFFGLDAALRHTSGIFKNYDQPLLFGPNNRSEGLSETQIRLMIKGRPNENLTYDIHLVQSLSKDTSLEGAATALGPVPGSTKYRAFEWSRDWLDEGGLSARIDIDRLQFKFRFPAIDITVGRQALTFGKTYFWNPMDLYFPFGSVQFDRDYKPGVDGVRVDIPTGDFSGLTLIGILGAGPATNRAFQSSVLGRAYFNISGWDAAIQAGKVEGGFHLSSALVGEVGSIETRASASYFNPQDSGLPREAIDTPEHCAVVLGVGKSFASRLSIQAEGLYNSAGSPPLDHALALAAAGQVLQAGRWMFGSSASYELSPLWRTSLAWIRSFSDGSHVIQPSIYYSLSSEVDILLGALMAVGRRPFNTSAYQIEAQSEFGLNPHLFYFETKAYF